jgi:3-oxoacyl-[acyl-carrier-protein] synthase II
MRRVVVTGVGFVTPAVAGGRAALAAALNGRAVPAPARVAGGVLAELIERDEARRLSRACQLAVAAGRLALADAGREGADGLGMIVGTEFGDLASTLSFVDGYLRRGPQGLSPLLFPNTVMNAMAATATIAVRARELSLTLNAPTVAGELAVARAASLIRADRIEAALAGGVDELDPLVEEVLGSMGAGDELRGEGAGFVVLEAEEAARARGARVLGELAGAASRALSARSYGLGRRTASRAIAAALEQAGLRAAEIGRVFTSASGDDRRNRWEEALLDAALAPHRPPRTTLAAHVRRHAGSGPLAVAAAALGAAASGGALVHAVARGGTHVALVVRRP